jgi:hypothetical protein
MNWADTFDGATGMAIEIAGTALLFLGVLCAAGVLLLVVYLGAKVLQAMLRLAIRQLRVKAFDSRVRFYPATPADEESLKEFLASH